MNTPVTYLDSGSLAIDVLAPGGELPDGAIVPEGQIAVILGDREAGAGVMLVSVEAAPTLVRSMELAADELFMVAQAEARA